MSPHEAACRRGPADTAEVVSGDAQTATILGDIPALPVVRFLDASAQPIGCLPVVIESSPGGTVLPLVDTTDDDGRIRVDKWVLGPGAGAQYLVASAANGVRAVVQVNARPGAPARVTLTGDGAKLGFIGQDLGRVVARVVDAGGNELEGVQVAFGAIGAKPVLSPAGAATDARGEARVAVRLDTVGTSTIIASVGTLPVATYQVRATGFRAREIVMGGHRACGLAADDRWYCWGYERDRPRLLRAVVTKLAIGMAHLCILAPPLGAVSCTGGNASGELGNGQTWPPPAGYAADTLGEFVQPLLPSGGFAAAVFAGDGNSCALLGQGDAWCWGANVSGGPSGAPLRVGAQFQTMHFSRQTACGIHLTGTTMCWGTNRNGEVGDGTTIDRARPTPVRAPTPFVALSGGCALASVGGPAYCWGPNSTGHVGDGTTIDRTVPTLVAGNLPFISLSTGNTKDCGLATGGAVYCWGDGVLVPTRVALPDGKLATAVATGEASVCVIAVGDEVFCWGENGRHELGDGTTTDRAVPVPVMPAPLP